MAGFRSTADWLLTKLNEINTDTGGDLPVRFEYLASMPEQFPAGYVLLDSGGAGVEIPVDNRTNELTVRFKIMLIFPTERSEEAFQKWCDMLDAMGNEFRKEANIIGDGHHNFVIEGYEQGETDEFNEPVVFLAVRVAAKMLKSI